MKAKCLLLFFLFSCVHLFSQHVDGYSKIAVRGGGYLQPVYVNAEKTIDPINLYGQALGVQYSFVNEKHAGIVLEVNYNQVGKTVDEVAYSFNFIQVPFLTHFEIPFKENGPYLSLDLGGYVYSYLNRDKKLHLEGDLVYGIGGGGGFHFPVKQSFLGLEGRYYYNLPTSYIEEDRWRSTWIELSVLFGFKL